MLCYGRASLKLFDTVVLVFSLTTVDYSGDSLLLSP